MANPTIIPSNYVSATDAFTKAPGVDRSGALRLVQGSVSVPASTATDTIIGLVPFNAGARFQIGNSDIYVADLDSSTNVTLDIGWAYNDTTLTDDLDAWVSASTAPQSGGFLTIDETQGLSFVALGDGWLVAQNNAATTTTGAITFAVRVAYDG